MAEVANPGSVTVDKGYYNIDGTNIIKFTSPIKKTLTEAAADLSDKNDIVLTLDSEGTSSFVLNGSDKTLTGYKKTHKLDSPSVYVDPSKQYILGTEPTGIGCSVDSYSAKGKVWERPNLTSATSYGTVSTNYTYSDQAEWMALDGNYGTHFTPDKTESWWKWELPIKIKYYQNVSKIIWVHRSNSENMGVSNNLQFFADEACTIPLTDKFSDPTTSNATVEVPIISTGKTNLIYLKIGAHSGWGAAAEIQFISFYEDVDTNGSVSLTKGWAYSDGRTYHNKDTGALSVSTLIGNAAGTVGYKNKLQLGYEPNSDISVPSISESLTLHAYDMNTDIYLDNTKSKILGTTAISESWAEGTTPYTITPGTSSSDAGSITYTSGYKYINEINGSFFIRNNTTKTLDELIVGDKAEQMGLYLVIKEDQSTDFVLSSTESTTNVTYAEKLQDVYLDRTLSYIYGNTADTRVKLTINATPNTATVNIVDSAPSTPVQVSSIGSATILVDPSNNSINYSVSAEGYTTTNSLTVTVKMDATLNVVLEAEKFTLTINPTPADATIILTAEGYAQSGNSITVPSGTSVQWSVTADGYTAQSGTQIVSSDLTLTITLESSTVETSTLSVLTDPADANIEISGDYKEIN